MKKVKVASLFASLRVGGGVEKIQSELSIGLTRIWYEFVHIVSEDICPRNNYSGEIISLNSPFIKGFWIRKLLRFFSDAWKVVKIVKKENIDVLIGQGDYFFMLSGLARIFWLKCKIIAVVHTTIGIRPIFVSNVLKFFLRIHDRIVMTSAEELNTFVQEYHFPKDKLHLIYNTIDMHRIEALIQENVPEIDFTPFTFINVGRLSYQKGQNRLLEAFEIVHAKNPNTQLLILWDWELKQDLFLQRKMLKAKDSIHFLGNQANVYKFLARSDCFVLSSRFEGFPVVLIEATCIGIPIISTNCPTWPAELLFPSWTLKLDWGQCIAADLGYLVDESSASRSLANAMNELLKKDNKITYDKQFYLDQFSPTKNISWWEKVISSL